MFGFTLIAYLAARLAPGEILLPAYAKAINRPRKRHGYRTYYVDWYKLVGLFKEDARNRSLEKARVFLSEGPLNLPVGIDSFSC